jgi:hypothetical protein
MSIRKILKPLSLLLFVTICFPDPSANALNLQKTIFDIEFPLKMSIQTDISHLINNREIIPIPAKIYITGNNFEATFNASIEVRGNFRRDPSNCDFPPLRLRFNETDVRGTIFEGNLDVKIVTHCRENSEKFIQSMSKEYTTYQLYNLLNPYSLKVKMVEVTYIDDQGELKPMNNQVFLIEDIHHLAERYNMKEVEGKFSEDDINKDNLLKLSVFQFMIGNTDWIIPFSKNLKFIQDDNRTLAVPYDFDYSGLVGTDYSRENGQSILAAPERKFKGPCYEFNDLQQEFNRLRGMKEELLDHINQSLYLKAKSKSAMKNYIDEFFQIIGSEKKITEYFQEKCN